MPKATEGGHTTQNYYRISPLSVASDITSPRQYPNIAATMQSNMSSQHMSQSGLSPYATGGPVQPLQYHQQAMPQSAPLPVRASSGAWTPSDDAQLMSARAQGLNWQPIQAAYFPNKTPNACRKRHERLMDRRNSDDWDVLKLENMAKEYMGMRRELWTQLGIKTGEKWTVVEAKCMQSGLKNLQSAARACARRERLEDPSLLDHPHSHSLSHHQHSASGSGSSLLPVQHPSSSHHHHHHHHSGGGGGGPYGDPHSADDSGIGLDELEAEYHSAAGDTTNGGSSVYGGQSATSLSPDDQEPPPLSGGSLGGGMGGSMGRGMGMGGPVKLYPAPVRGGGGGGYERGGSGAEMGYVTSSSGRGTERGGYGGGGGGGQQHQGQGQMQQQQQQQRAQQQYGLQQRLPSIDMGIGAIINRPLGSL